MQNLQSVGRTTGFNTFQGCSLLSVHAQLELVHALTPEAARASAPRRSVLLLLSVNAQVKSLSISTLRV